MLLRSFAFWRIINYFVEMKIAPFTFLFVLGLTAPAWARLGETGDQLVARYGQPLSEMDQKGAGAKVALVDLVFQKNGYEIDVSLSDGISSTESYRKLNGEAITLEEVQTILGLNGQGAGWEAPQKGEGEQKWTRDDGATATLKGGQVLVLTSKELMAKETTAKKLEQKPSLDGF
jgi:hypothetical protein